MRYIGLSILQGYWACTLQTLQKLNLDWIHGILGIRKRE